MTDFSGARVAACADTRLGCSFFANTYDNRPKPLDTTWGELVGFLADWREVERPATDSEKKTATPLFSPAVFLAGERRCNINVREWVRWLALDIDHGMRWDEAIACAKRFGADFCAYTSTFSKVSDHRFRVIWRLDRPVAAVELTALWAGCHAVWNGVIDAQCKDASRMYFVPATWTASAENLEPFCRFVATNEGWAMRVDWLIAQMPASPPAPAPPAEQRKPPEGLPTPATVVKRKPAKIKRNFMLDHVSTSPLVSSDMINRYLQVPNGEHHLGLYAFMVAVAGRAAWHGYPVTVDELVTYARQLNDMSVIRTASQRWWKIEKEAERAIDWVRRNPLTP